MKPSLITFIVAVTLTLTACGGTTTFPVPEPAPVPTGLDRTVEVASAVSADLTMRIVFAETLNNGTTVVHTDFIKPDAAGSAEAALVVSVCETVTTLPGITAITILDADEQPFASNSSGVCAED
jgi:hypothetical protein